MYDYIHYTHLVSVILFLVIYLVKTPLLLTNKKEVLASFTKITKVPEMIVSVLFLATGVYMLTQVGQIGTLLIIKLGLVLASIPVAIIGFKKANKMLAVLALLMIIGAYGLAEMNKKKMLKANPVESNEGKEIFSAKCARCHGDDGKAGLMGAYNLSVSVLDSTAVNSVVTNGKELMPAFKDVLTPEQIRSVCGYAETLKK